MHDFPNDQFVADLFGAATFGLVLFFVLATIAILAVFVFYCLLLQKTMNRVSEANRPLPGGLVWLAFVPILNIIWLPIFQILLSSAIKKDFVAAGRPDHLDGGLPLAIGMAVCLALAFVPFVNMFSGLAHIVLWIVYWVRVSELKNKMPVATTVYITRV